MATFFDQILKALFISKATEVVPDDDNDLPIAGVLFLDENGTEGYVKVDLMNGGTIKLNLLKSVYLPFIVKKVYDSETTASGIMINPIQQ